MQYRLRTLVMLTTFGPPVLAFVWFYGVPALFVLVMVVYWNIAAAPFLLFSLMVPLLLGWVFSLAAKLLIYVATSGEQEVSGGSVVTTTQAVQTQLKDHFETDDRHDGGPGR